MCQHPLCRSFQLHLCREVGVRLPGFLWKLKGLQISSFQISKLRGRTHDSLLSPQWKQLTKRVTGIWFFSPGSLAYFFLPETPCWQCFRILSPKCGCSNSPWALCIKGSHRANWWEVLPSCIFTAKEGIGFRKKKPHHPLIVNPDSPSV